MRNFEAFETNHIPERQQPDVEVEWEKISVRGYAKREELPLLQDVAQAFSFLSDKLARFEIKKDTEQFRISDEFDYQEAGIKPNTKLPLKQSEIAIIISGTIPVDHFIKAATRTYQLKQELKKDTQKSLTKKQAEFYTGLEDYVIESIRDSYLIT